MIMIERTTNGRAHACTIEDRLWLVESISLEYLCRTHVARSYPYLIRYGEWSLRIPYCVLRMESIAWMTRQFDLLVSGFWMRTRRICKRIHIEPIKDKSNRWLGICKSSNDAGALCIGFIFFTFLNEALRFVYWRVASNIIEMIIIWIMQMKMWLVLIRSVQMGIHFADVRISGLRIYSNENDRIQGIHSSHLNELPFIWHSWLGWERNIRWYGNVRQPAASKGENIVETIDASKISLFIIGHTSQWSWLNGNMSASPAPTQNVHHAIIHKYLIFAKSGNSVLLRESKAIDSTLDAAENAQPFRWLLFE